MTRNRQVLAIVFTRAEDRRRRRRGCGPSQPLAVSARHARAERERERKRKEGNRGWSLSNEDGKSRAVRLFNIQGWSVTATRCVSRCHCYTPGSLSAMTISRVLFSESERAGERASNPLSCHPSFQFPSRVILCPSTPPCPSAKIALFSGTVFLANSSITSFAHEASTRTTMYVDGYPRPRSYIEFFPRQLSGKWLLLSHWFSNNRTL